MHGTERIILFAMAILFAILVAVAVIGLAGYANLIQIPKTDFITLLNDLFDLVEKKKW